MKTYALFAVDKYRNHKFVVSVLADSLSAAASKLGGTVTQARAVRGQSDPYLLTFQHGREAAQFAPGNCTDEVLAGTATPEMRAQIKDIVGFHRYGRTDCYIGFLIGEVPVI